MPFTPVSWQMILNMHNNW